MQGVVLLAGWIVVGAITGLALGVFFRRFGWEAAGRAGCLDYKPEFLDQGRSQ